MYSEESTSLLVLIIGALTIFVSWFSLSVTMTAGILSVVTLIYLLWYRGAKFEEAEPTLLGFLPGHYLIFLAFTLNGAPSYPILVSWSVLILSTLAYDRSVNAAANDYTGKLTKMALYCIIWGVIVFLFQQLLVYGLDLNYPGALFVRLGISIAGIIWVAIGVVRINSGFTEGRS